MAWVANYAWDNATGSTLVQGEPSYRPVHTVSHLTVGSGHQGILRLVDYVAPNGRSYQGRSGVELRIFLEPLKLPPIRTDPYEVDGTNLVAGYHPGWTTTEVLKAIEDWPVDQ